MTPHNEFVASEIDAYLDYLELQGVSKVTKEHYTLYLKKFLNHIGEYGANQDSINKIMLKYNHGLFRATLKSYFEFRSITNIKIPKRSGRMALKKRKYLSPEHLERIGEVMLEDEPPRYYLMLMLSYLAGLRRKECVNINVADFDFDGWIREGKVNNCLLKINLEGAKGRKERYVYLEPQLAKALYNHVVDNKSRINRAEGKIFYVSKFYWNRVFKRCTRKADLPEFSLHDLRRGRASFWYKEGKDLMTIKNRLGHADLSTTQRYIVDDGEFLKKWKKE